MASENDQPADYIHLPWEEGSKFIAAIDPETTAEVLEQLALNASFALLERIAEHPNCPENLQCVLSVHPCSSVRAALTENPSTPEEILSMLCSDDDADVRYFIAENHLAPRNCLEQLIHDPNPYVAERAKKTLRNLSPQLVVASDHAESDSEPEPDEIISRRQRILVIEDNPADIRLLEKQLSTHPFDIESANRLSAAITLLRKKRFDIVLLDLSLPDAQGIDTFYQLHCQAPNVPIVVLTGLEDESVGHEAVQSGAQDYLVKGQVPSGLLARSIKYAIERHQAEIKMRQLNESLEQRIIQLAKANVDLDKMGKALALSCEQAVQASNFKSEFVARISHEIRTPISAVLGITDLLLRDDALEENQEMKRLIELIDESARSQLRILSEVLDFSKVEAGKVEIENVEFSPVALLEDIAELFAASAAKKKLSIMSYIDAGLQPLLVGDPIRLREILINLTNNALKFTSNGEVVLRVTKESEDGGYVTARFSVADTGLGMSANTSKHLFEPFLQSQRSQQYGGTGLGLSICKRLVDLMGGQIAAESREDKGSTFWFSVRLKRSLGFDTKQEGAVLPPTQKVFKQNIRALIVNTNSTARDIIQRYVNAAGWTGSATAANAEEALDMLEHAQADSRPYDVAIIDLGSSAIDNFALAAKLKEDPTLRETPLIYLVDIDKRQQGEKALAFGFAAYLTKPIKQWHLLDCISDVIEQKTVTAKAKESASGSAQTKNKRVLVVEDVYAMRYALVQSLKELGLEADSAENGLEAVSAVKEKEYGLILMDCQMPKMNGIDATRAIRALRPDSAHTPIVAVTSGDAPGMDKKTCLEAGMDDYKTKPVTIEELRQLLLQYHLLNCRCDRD